MAPPGGGLLHVAEELTPALFPDYRAEFGLRIDARAHGERFGLLRQRPDEVIGDGPHAHGDAAGEAALARAAEGGADHVRHGGFEIGVVHDDEMVLGAPQRLHPLPLRGGLPVDGAGDAGRSDEGHGHDVGMGDQCVDGLLAAVHDVQHAVGQTGLAEQFGEPNG